MQISQKEQLNNNGIKADMLDVLIILMMFANAILKFVLYFLNIQSESGQLAIMYIIVAVISACLCFRHFSRMIQHGFLSVIILFVAIGVSFVITGLSRDFHYTKYYSELKSYLAMAVCIIFLTLLIAWKKKRDINLKVIFAAVIILTVISFVSLFRHDSDIAGYIRDSSGLTYQNVSYFSAYAFGLTLFHITETVKSRPLSWFYKLIYFVFLAIQAATCFLAGGRGGLVLLVVLFVASVFMYWGKKAYRIVVPAVIILIFLRYAFPFVISLLGINVKGIERVMDFFNGGLLDDGRMSLYLESLGVFGDSPVFGHGIGSIFYYLKSYSHNLFLDVLSETGVVGLLIFLFVLIVFIKKISMFYRQGSLFRFLTIMFICGFTLNMFSGYFWNNQHLWLPIAVALTIHKNEFEHNVINTFESDDVVPDEEPQTEADIPDDTPPLKGENDG